jgi:arylsulfatase A-like enzyme
MPFVMPKRQFFENQWLRTKCAMLFFIWLLATGILAALPLRAAAGPPNVLVVMTSDQGYGDLSSSGHPQLKTPHLDRLRGEGADFKRCIAAPDGTATRAEVLSGCHEFRCGVSHRLAGRNLPRAGVVFLPEVFKAAGYRTGLIGRWGLGEAFPCRPEDRGFEDVWVCGGAGLGQTADRWGNGNLDPWVRTHAGWEARAGYSTQVWVAEAKRWLGARATERRPFFLHLGLTAPHAPYEAPAGTAEHFLKAGMKEPAASFHAMIEDLDGRVGELLAELDRLGLAEDTIVVFTGDNGSAQGTWDAGLRGAHGSPDEGGVRVPACVRWPGKIAAGTTVTPMVSTLDWFETLLRLAGLKPPTGWRGDGVDLSAALLGKAAFPGGRMLFTHVGAWPGDDSPERHRSVGFAVRDDRWLLSGLELFEMAADGGQRENGFEAHQHEATRLLAAYGAWWRGIQQPVREPVRYVIGHERQPIVWLTASDWWPCREVSGAVGAEGLATQAAVRRTLAALAAGATVPETAGLWKLQVAQDGHYRVTLTLLPAEAGAAERTRLGQLKAGVVHLRTGKRESKMPVSKGATAVTLRLDLSAGELDLETWFTGQLPGGRILGAFFAEIAREGPRKRPELELDFHTVPKK